MKTAQKKIQVVKGTAVQVSETRFNRRSFVCPSCGTRNEKIDGESSRRTKCVKCPQVIKKDEAGTWWTTRNVLKVSAHGGFSVGSEGQFEAVTVAVSEQFHHIEKYSWRCPNTECSSSNEQLSFSEDIRRSKISGNLIVVSCLICWNCQLCLKQDAEGTWRTDQLAEHLTDKRY
jgi:hypothetical protein